MEQFDLVQGELGEGVSQYGTGVLGGVKRIRRRG